MLTTQAETAADLDLIRRLFREYEKSIGIDLCFQNFESELASLPGDYAPPAGCLLLARVGNRPVGCVALRRIDREICEMKRLYIIPDYRGLGYGRLIVERVIGEAVSRGYAKMRLDTLPSMTEAIALYETLGFARIETYRFNPIPGAVYMEKNLQTQGAC